MMHAAYQGERASWLAGLGGRPGKFGSSGDEEEGLVQQRSEEQRRCRMLVDGTVR